MRCLYAADVDQRPGVLSEPADLAEMYAYPGEPWLRANMVTSVDGAAAVQGSSLGMSSPADRRVLNLLRGLADVILVGAETARREPYKAASPKESWQAMRRAAGQPPAPTFAIISRRLDLDDASPLLHGTHPEARTIVLTSGSAPAERRHELDNLDSVAEVIIAGEHEVDLSRAVDELVDRGLTRLLCEGGPSLLGGLAEAGRLDEVCLTLHPVLVGGGAGRILSGETLPQLTRMTMAHVLEEDGDLFLRYRREA